MQRTTFLLPGVCRTLALALAFSAAALLPARAGEVELDHDIPVKYGWNAIYVEVSPTNSLSDIFDGWPTDSVGLYDPAAFLATRQYTASTELQAGIAIAPIAMWHRDNPAASEALSMPANTVCIFFSTNENPTAVRVRGIPAAPRTTWHVTGPKLPYNFFGLSLQADQSTTLGDYLDGFPGIKSLSGIYHVTGTNADVPPLATRVYSTTKLQDSGVLLVPSSEISDWSGVFCVSPMDGLDYGTNAVQRLLQIRNDGTRERTAAVDLVRPVDAGARDLLPALHLRDAAVVLTNASWISPTSPRLASKVLQPGETWQLEVGLDRSMFDNDVRGTPFGAVLRITDDGGASKLRVDVPLRGTASGKSSNRDAWPGGLWIAQAAFDEIRFEGDSSEAYTPAGGTLKVRMPMHIDAEGNVRLLQRVVVAGSTAADGSFAYTLYGGKAEVPATARETLRVSSAVLPTEQPVIQSLAGAFENGILFFQFTVGADGSTSILRHPTHPQHDGLRWDFKTPAPSGDDFENYKSTVKPELFSVSNTIAFNLDFNGGEASWNPEEEKTGTCLWRFDNLRHEGAITIKGPMSVSRIAPQTDIVLE